MSAHQQAHKRRRNAACGVGNQNGLRLFTGKDRDLIELGLLRMEAAGYRILAPGELDGETLEAAAAKADMWDTTAAGMISKAIRNPRSAG